MKLTKAIAAAAVFVCGITWLPALSSYASEDPLVDSGIDYTESMETLLNPGAGYSSTVAVNCKPNDTKVYNPTSSLVVLFVDIGAFSSGANGTTNEDGTYVDGTDYDLNELGNFPTIPCLGNILSAGRSRGIRVNAVIQDIQQMEKNYKESCKSNSLFCL